ncbi:hypothetical protein ACF0H5_018762 [Mactra antiquata]
MTNQENTDLTVGEAGITLTVRLIRSFEHRTIKHVVFHDVDRKQSVGDFIGLIRNEIKTRPGLPPPFRIHPYDTIKISHQPFGAKTSDPVINKENDEELLLKNDDSLKQCNIVNETELSFFVIEDYKTYQQNPTLTW